MPNPIALITGGAQGIGFACGQALAADGAQVILADIQDEAVKAAAAHLGQGAAGYAVDMADPDQITAMFDAIERDYGPVSILVNNAGIALPGDFLDLPVERFKAVLDVNLTGVFVALQRAARTMVAEGIKGAIVNMSSINAVVSIPEIAAYSASKGAVGQLTKAASLALAPHGIRVNAVGPGSIDTAMMAGVNADAAALHRALSRTPMGRLGAPEEIAQVVAFLASDKASYVTGETIYADGGRLGLNYTVPVQK